MFGVLEDAWSSQGKVPQKLCLSKWVKFATEFLNFIEKKREKEKTCCKSCFCV